MAGKQISFPENQTHNKAFEYAMVGFSIFCIIMVIIAVNVVGGGGWPEV